MDLKVGAYGQKTNIEKLQSQLAEGAVTPIETAGLDEVNRFAAGLMPEQTVLIVNADHVVFQNDFETGESLLESQQCDILFSASAAFHYDDDVLRYYFWKYYPREKGHYHYLDSNAFIGSAGKISAFIEQLKSEYPSHFSFHDLLTRFFVDSHLGALKTDLIVEIDRDQHVFGNVEGRKSAYRWPLVSWMHADLFTRLETAALSAEGKTDFQDKLWDVVYSKKEGRSVNKKTKSKPLLWIAEGTAEHLTRVEKRLNNERRETKPKRVWLSSYGAYVHSIFSFLYAWLINRGETRPYRIFRFSANKNPEWQAVMEKFLGHLERKEGFTFAHFNDGELTFIKKFLTENHAETWFGRRQQKYTKTLGAQLTKALKLEKDNYYVGVPCSTHHPRLRRLADSLIAGKAGVVPAMSLHHNIRYFPNIINHMKDRPCYFVKNDYQKLDVFEKLGVEIKEENLIKVPFKNSYLLFDELKERSFPDGAIVILICGMLAKIIIPEWFERNPNTTFIALGSSMDDFIQRTNTKFRLYPKEGLPLTCNIQPTKFFAFGWKKECKECWSMEEHV